MNFFWKIFLSIMLMMVFFFNFGFFYVIHSGFQYSLNREIAAVYEENDILLYTLSNEVNRNLFNDPNSVLNHGAPSETWMIRTANAITIRTSKGVVPFRISDGNYKSIYESNWISINQALLEKLPKQSRGYEIILENGSYFIHAAAPITILDKTYYVENHRNITALFENREQQFYTCFYLMICMIIVGGGITLAVATWLTNPIRKLSAATKRFEQGDFTQRVPSKGCDELALLANDFNSMAKRLEQTVEELKEAAQRQEDFVNNFTHELKTPLTSIIGYSDMIRSKKMNPELVVECANYIFGEGKRLETLSMKLMEMIILKNQSFSFQFLESCCFLSSIEGAYRPIFLDNKIEFEVSCESALLWLEPDLMKTVCINLLDNARKAVKEHGKVSMIGKKTAQGFDISIYDNGIGMTETELSRITEAFYMIDKSRSRAQGSAGLGLSICSEIITMHGGTLSFESAPQKGTCATIHLKGGHEDEKT